LLLAQSNEFSTLPKSGLHCAFANPHIHIDFVIVATCAEGSIAIWQGVPAKKSILKSKLGRNVHLDLFGFVFPGRFQLSICFKFHTDLGDPTRRLMRLE
jgi:hypothetical protein